MDKNYVDDRIKTLNHIKIFVTKGNRITENKKDNKERVKNRRESKK